MAAFEVITEAARELLELLLRDVFVETSTACLNRLDELSYPPVVGEGIFGGCGTEGDYVVRGSLERWKEGLAACITRVFESFVEGREPQREEQHPGDIAKRLAWEAIDQDFHWTRDERSNSTRFKEWLSKAAYPEPEHPSIIGLPGWQALAAERLTRDFPEWFESLLNKLSLEALVKVPTAQSTQPHLEGVSQEHSTESTGTAEKLQEQGGVPNLLKFNGDLWAVRFDGGSVSSIRDFVGVQYIALVLQQKLAGKHDLTPAELVALRLGPEAQPEEALPELEIPDELVPSRVAKIVKNKIAEIDAKLERASSTEIDDLLDEKTKYQEYLASGRAKRPGADRSYRPAVFPGNFKRALDAVRKAIKEATAKMARDKALASLAAHLDTNIKYGKTVSYDGSIAWTVEPGFFPRKTS